MIEIIIEVVLAIFLLEINLELDIKIRLSVITMGAKKSDGIIIILYPIYLSHLHLLTNFHYLS